MAEKWIMLQKWFDKCLWMFRYILYTIYTIIFNHESGYSLEPNIDSAALVEELLEKLILILFSYFNLKENLLEPCFFLHVFVYILVPLKEGVISLQQLLFAVYPTVTGLLILRQVLEI